MGGFINQKLRVGNSRIFSTKKLKKKKKQKALLKAKKIIKTKKRKRIFHPRNFIFY